MIIIIIIIIIIIRAGDSLTSWGEGSSLDLVGNPSRDKNTGVEAPQTHPSVYL